MNRQFAIALLAVGLLSATAARADNAILGAAIGGGAGALIGKSVGGRDGAIVGGALGAAAGVVIAGETSRPRVVEYVPAPVYAPPPVFVEARPVVYYARDRHWEEWREHQRWAHEQWRHGHDWREDRHRD